MVTNRRVRKLRQARSLLDNLRAARSGDEFAHAFSACLTAIKSVFDVLWKDFRGRKGYRVWYEKKKHDIKADPLMSFLFELRHKDLHEGERRLLFSTHVERMTVTTPPGASFVLNPDGAYRVFDEGKPSERRVPVRQGRYTTAVAITNPPDSHLGQPIADKSPVGLRQLGIDYLQNVLTEASTKFP